MTVKLGKHIYIFKFKVVELLAEGHALQQIKNKGYANKYRSQGSIIHLMGVEFSNEKPNVVRFEVESDKNSGIGHNMGHFGVGSGLRYWHYRCFWPLHRLWSITPITQA